MLNSNTLLTRISWVYSQIAWKPVALYHFSFYTSWNETC